MKIHHNAVFTHSIDERQLYRLEDAARALSCLSVLLIQAETANPADVSRALAYPLADLRKLIHEIGGEA